MSGIKHKTPLAAALVVVFFVSLYFVIFHVLIPSSKELELVRGTFKKIAPLKKRPKFSRLFVEGPTHNSFVTVNFKNRYERRFTIKGAILYNTDESKKSLEINHNLRSSGKGEYIIDFLCFYPPVKINKDSNAFVEIYPSDSTRSRGNSDAKPVILTKLKKDEGVKRHQIPLKISSGDILAFSMVGKGFAIFSEPVIYREEVYKKEEKKLVFIISADTLRQDHVGVYNNRKKCTPVIDRFAGDAVIFTNAYSTSSWTFPAHASLFTGIPAHRHSLNFRNRKKNQNMQNTLFEPLQKKYITVSFNGGLFLSHYFGFAHGFDCYNEARDDTNNAFAAKFLFRNARAYIQQDRTNVPLLFFLHTYQIHSLFHPEKILAKKYFKHTPYKYDSFEILSLIQRGKDRYTKNSSAEEREEIIKVYDAGIYTFDYRFGQFIDFLKIKNLYNSSLIILLSDHGEEFMDHGGWEHGHTLYNELIKIPLIIKFPGNQWGGIKVDKVVSLVDILPTVLALNGIKYKNKRSLKIKHHGISLLDIINQPGAADRRKVISYLAPYACSRTPMKTAVISRKFKFIYNKKFKDDDVKYYLTPPPPFPGYELYNLSNDVLEKTNVKHKNRSQFHKMLKILKTLKYKKSKSVFPEQLRDELKRLGYID